MNRLQEFLLCLSCTISNLPKVAICSPNGFRILRHLAEKRTTLLIHRTYGHPVPRAGLSGAYPACYLSAAGSLYEGVDVLKWIGASCSTSNFNASYDSKACPLSFAVWYPVLLLDTTEWQTKMLRAVGRPRPTSKKIKNPSKTHWKSTRQLDPSQHFYISKYLTETWGNPIFTLVLLLSFLFLPEVVWG